MFRIEQYLANNGRLCWSLKIAIVIFWLFGVIHIQGLIAEMRNQKSPKIDRSLEPQAYKIADAAYLHAKKLGVYKYTPELYFKDLIKIRKIFRKSGAPAFGDHIDDLMEILRPYWLNKHEDAFVKARQTCELELDQIDNIKKLTPVEVKDQNRKLVWGYAISCLLSMLIYMIRITEKGSSIVAIVLTNPFLFVLACIFWPKFYFSFPDPDVFCREVIAEARYRALRGAFFRKLTDKEQKFLQTITFSERTYEEWLDSLALSNNQQLKLSVSLPIALLLVLIVQLLACLRLPASTSSQYKNRQHATVTVASSRDGPVCTAEKKGPSDNQNQFKFDLILPDRLTIETVYVVFGEILESIFLTQQRPKKISHVPLLGWLNTATAEIN